MKTLSSHKLRLATCLIALLVASTAIAEDLNTQAQKMFNDLGAVGNLTPPQAFKGQTMNTYTGGSMYIRTPTKGYQLGNLQLPYIHAGCGGIDAFGGSFSHISSAQFKNMMKNITSAIPGVLFQMMLASVEPLLDSEMKWFKGIETLVNNRNISSCTMAKIAADGIANGGHLSQEACKTAALQLGIAKDGAEATEQCKDSTGVNSVFAQSKTDPVAKDIIPFSGNLIWQILKKTNPGLDQDDIELIMSMTGTTIYADKVDGAPEPQHIMPTIRNVADLMYGNLDNPSSPAPGQISIDLVKCPVRDINDPCLISPATPRTTVTMQALSDRTRALMQSISDKIATRSGVPTAAEQSFINAVPMPIYKLLSASTAINNADIPSAKINQYADYVAVEFAYGLLSRAARLGVDSTGYQESHLEPKQITQLAAHRENARQLMRTLESDRLAAYTKAQAFVSIAQDIEQLQRNMRSSMSQQMSDLMAFSGMNRR